ncbi:MAG: phycobilisome protein [Cyanobacteria bacterium P01_H01_bin.15]
MPKPALSPQVLELIQKARIVSFQTWETTHSESAIAIFQAADDERRYLTAEDYQALADLAPTHTQFFVIAQQLEADVKNIVDEARQGVLRTFPDIAEPGGRLYPAMRAEACWRDFWQFLRCVTYGIAGQETQYTSAEGLHYMNLLYQELQVPLDAMIVGLKGLKTASLKRINPECKSAIAPYFDHLIDCLAYFS